MSRFETNRPSDSDPPGDLPQVMRFIVRTMDDDDDEIAFCKLTGAGQIDYPVKVASPKDDGDAFLAIRPINGTGKSYDGKPVQWEEVAGGGSGALKILSVTAVVRSPNSYLAGTIPIGDEQVPIVVLIPSIMAENTPVGYIPFEVGDDVAFVPFESDEPLGPQQIHGVVCNIPIYFGAVGSVFQVITPGVVGWDFLKLN